MADEIFVTFPTSDLKIPRDGPLSIYARYWEFAGLTDHIGNDITKVQVYGYMQPGFERPVFLRTTSQSCLERSRKTLALETETQRLNARLGRWDESQDSESGCDCC